MDFDALYREAMSVWNPRQLSAHAQAGTVAAAPEAESGAVYRGVCIDTACSLGFCAEHAAAAAMVTAGEGRVLRMVAVGREGKILPPCGRCRELIVQLHPENVHTQVMVAPDVVLEMRNLLPHHWLI